MTFINRDAPNGESTDRADISETEWKNGKIRNNIPALEMIPVEVYPRARGFWSIVGHKLATSIDAHRRSLKRRRARRRSFDLAISRALRKNYEINSGLTFSTYPTARVSACGRTTLYNDGETCLTSLCCTVTLQPRGRMHSIGQFDGGGRLYRRGLNNMCALSTYVLRV
jgi:hypothetical protein